ncbi:UNVERIFIED_CONTAM: putative membrane protein (TIGR04086 family) [Acetivibrio alkalicellulosi]
MINKTGQTAKNIISEHANKWGVAKGIIVSYLITMPIFLIFAYVLTFTDFPQKYIPLFVIITTLISIALAGWVSTKNVRSRGWLNGGIVGFIYMLVLFILSSITFETFAINKHVVSMFVIGILTGSIGGILGINFKKDSRIKVKKKNF